MFLFIQESHGESCVSVHICLCILIHRLRLDFRCEYMRFAMSAVLLNENVVLRLFADFGQMPM